jgi:hypothetical protein
MHFAVVPFPLPEQFQFQGPVPETVDALPMAQRLLVGADLEIFPEALPHSPSVCGELTVKGVDFPVIQLKLESNKPARNVYVPPLAFAGTVHELLFVTGEFAAKVVPFTSVLALPTKVPFKKTCKPMV